MTIDRNYRQIFKQFVKTDTSNIAIQILVDMSGSMRGSKMETARRSTVALSEALKSLNIKFEVTGFNSIPDERVIAFGKECTDRLYDRKKERLDLHIFKSFDTVNLNGIEKMSAGRQNPDGEAVQWASSRLAQRKEKRKILLVLSDGIPETSDTDNQVLNSDLKNKVLAIERSGVECIAIGIKSEAVRYFYKDYVVVNDIKLLPTVVMAKLAKIITKS
jgi:cobalamin biosynthesis protein CobT